jgi:hypothetical protein
VTSQLPKFRPGNVIKSPTGHVEIVTRTDGQGVHTIWWDAENVSGYGSWEDTSHTATCPARLTRMDWMTDDDPSCDWDCDHCHGTQEVVVLTRGYNKARLLAANVKDLLIIRLTELLTK